MRFFKFCLVVLAGLVMVTVFLVVLSRTYGPRNSSYFRDIQEKVRESMESLQSSRKPEVLPRKIVLTAEETINIKSCTDMKDTDLAKSSSEFWHGETRTIRWTSHTYLTNQSMVLDIGGNVGLDADEFMKRYNSKLVIFEPLPTLTSLLRGKFNGSANVRILGLGLGKRDMEIYMEQEGNNGEGSSLYTGKNVTGATAEKVSIKNTTAIFAQIGLGSHFVDLLHVDCEGCEIDVLEDLLETNIVSNLRHIQFATHTQYSGIENLVPRYCRLQEILKRTHKSMYQYKFLWESWEMRTI